MIYSQKSKTPIELGREVVAVGSIVKFVSSATSDADSFEVTHHSISFCIVTQERRGCDCNDRNVNSSSRKKLISEICISEKALSFSAQILNPVSNPCTK
jgi:hypothetical protein